MSSLGWIDFSSEHRDKVRTVLDLLKKQGVVDELGIGVIRDAFSDRMFPGISTVQTRAKYFTLVAYRIEAFMQRSGRKQTLESYLSVSEKQDRIKLVENHEGEGELGIIGGTFKTDWKRDVVRKPSSIYWNGLRTFGFVTPDTSLSEFSARLSEGKTSLRQVLRGTKEDDGDATQSYENRAPRVAVQSPDKEYWETLRIDLNLEEARLLRQHITDQEPDSLIGQILLHPEWLEQTLQISVHAPFKEFCELPFIKKIQVPGLTATVEHARDFWQVMKGAHIRYNCLLQRGADDPTLEEQFEGEWEEWLDDMNPFPDSWDNDFFWGLVGTRSGSIGPTNSFVARWIEQTRQGCPDLGKCDELVRLQEMQNKGPRARLRSDNREGHPSDWLGIRDLNYRLPIVLQILRDIYDAEMKGGDLA